MAMASMRSGLLQAALRDGSRPTAPPKRGFASSSHHDDAYETTKWEKIAYLGATTCTVLAIYNLSKGHPHHEEPPAIFAHLQQGVPMGYVILIVTVVGGTSCMLDSSAASKGVKTPIVIVIPGLTSDSAAADRERVGTSSRQKQKFTHTTGSRSFACVVEAEEVSSGQKVGRLQLFDMTHRKKNGSPITSEAGEIMEKLKENKAEYEAVALTDSSVNHEDIDNRIIIEVLGPESSQQYMPSGSQSQAEVQWLKDQIAQMQASTVEQIAKVQRKYEELQQQLIADAVEREAEAAAMAAEQSRKYDELQLQLEHMMKMFQQSQKPPS
ncbi:hypothetical protein J1N35_014082 [Gossypium stocksii]|uniref:Uncharacterized protein n=1 Tax=Gossypium stocksii TaxID=47602 RepID=A0A9D4A9D9_9ROSI|nr:hypothetical protein J1N35_014082 [Gossypium stocksii]